MPPLRFGLRLPQDGTDLAELRDVAQAAEQLGYHSLWLFDHFYHFPFIGNRSVLEPWPLLPPAGAVGEDGGDVVCPQRRPAGVRLRRRRASVVIRRLRLRLSVS